MFENIAVLLRQSALRWPACEALVEGDRRLTYAQFDELVSRTADALRGLGLQAGGHVAVISTNCYEQVTTHLGAVRAGCVAVLFNPRLTADEILSLMQLTHPRAVVFDGELSETMGEVRRALGLESSIHWIAIRQPLPDFATSWETLVRRASGRYDPADVSDGAPALMMFTSGTTGLPKAVVIERRAEWLNSLIMIGELGLRPGERTLNIAPLFHAAPWDCFFVPHMAAGGVNVITRGFDPEQMRHLLDQERITTLLAVPTHFELSMKSGIAKFGMPRFLRMVAVTGAPTRWESLSWIREHLCRSVFNIYGLTEATTLITVCPPEEIERSERMPCIGRSLLGMEVRLVPLDARAPTSEAVPPGEPGQLICRGPKLMIEYYRNPEKTAERIREGWLFTGDVCYRDQDDYFYIADRLDDVIITGGEKVYPTEVEAVLNRHPGVRDCVVLGIPDDVWGNRMKAFIVPKAPDLTPEAVLTWIRENRLIADYKRPREIELIDAIPRNPSGKVLKKLLRRKNPAARTTN